MADQGEGRVDKRKRERGADEKDKVEEVEWCPRHFGQILAPRDSPLKKPHHMGSHPSVCGCCAATCLACAVAKLGSKVERKPRRVSQNSEGVE